MPRCETHLEPGKLVFRFHSFSTFLFFFIPAFCGFWVYAGLHQKQQPGLFFEAWSAVFGAFLVCVWVWNLTGREELEFTPRELRYRRVWFGRFARTKVYEAHRMSAPHFLVRPWRHHRIRTAIGFTYTGKEIRVCDGIRQPEAKAVADAVLRQFPELAPIWGRYAAGVPIRSGYTVLDLK